MRVNILESKFQQQVIRELKERLPGCIVLKNDPNYIQGIPDLLVLYGEKWAALECKRSADAKRRPNQEFYISKMDEMGIARFIYPENKEETLDEIQQALSICGTARCAGSKQIPLGELR